MVRISFAKLYPFCILSYIRFEKIINTKYVKVRPTKLLYFSPTLGLSFFWLLTWSWNPLNPFLNVKNVHETQLGNNILDPKHQFKVLKKKLFKINLVTYFKVTHNLLKRYKNTFWNRTNINVEHSKTMYGFFFKFNILKL